MTSSLSLWQRCCPCFAPRLCFLVSNYSLVVVLTFLAAVLRVGCRLSLFFALSSYFTLVSDDWWALHTASGITKLSSYINSIVFSAFFFVSCLVFHRHFSSFFVFGLVSCSLFYPLIFFCHLRFIMVILFGFLPPLDSAAALQYFLTSCFHFSAFFSSLLPFLLPEPVFLQFFSYLTESHLSLEILSIPTN